MDILLVVVKWAFILVGVLMTILILLQEGKGGGLAGLGGTKAAGVEGVSNPVRRATAYMAGLWFLLAIVLGTYAIRTGGRNVNIESGEETKPAATSPANDMPAGGPALNPAQPPTEPKVNVPAPAGVPAGKSETPTKTDAPKEAPAKSDVPAAPGKTDAPPAPAKTEAAPTEAPKEAPKVEAPAKTDAPAVPAKTDAAPTETPAKTEAPAPSKVPVEKRD